MDFSLDFYVLLFYDFLCTKAFMDVLLFQGSSFGIKMFMVRMDLYRFYES